MVINDTRQVIQCPAQVNQFIKALEALHCVLSDIGMCLHALFKDRALAASVT
jgi:hypothetical protein